MKQEDKDLLLKDLCVRLPYKTYVKTTKGIGYIYAINTSQLIELSVANETENWSEVFNIDEIKPYFRPMSSMTKKEQNEYDILVEETVYRPGVLTCSMLINFCNEHHLDNLRLIEKNLALDCTGLHIYD